jgi:hypothetical protein
MEYKVLTIEELNFLGNTIIYLIEDKKIEKKRIFDIIYLMRIELRELDCNYCFPKYSYKFKRFYNFNYKIWLLDTCPIEFFHLFENNYTLGYLKNFIKLEFTKDGECFITSIQKYKENTLPMGLLRFLDKYKNDLISDNYKETNLNIEVRGEDSVYGWLLKWSLKDNYFFKQGILTVDDHVLDFSLDFTFDNSINHYFLEKEAREYEFNNSFPDWWHED